MSSQTERPDRAFNDSKEGTSVGCQSNQSCQPAFSIDETLAQVKEMCRQNGFRFTKLREQVYRLILQADKPLGAYDLLRMMQQQANEQLQATDKKKNIAPPTVYRSLDFLLECGLIHQLTSMNAFVSCCHPHDKHVAGFLICQQCERVQECSNYQVENLVKYTKEQIGFAVEKTVIEMFGVCQHCQK